MKAIFRFLIVGGIMPLMAKAQLNESDTARFQYKLGVSGNYQKGNVELFTLRSRLEFSVKPTPNWVFKSQNSSLYQSFGGRKADNDLFSRNYLYFRPHQRVYPFAISYVSANFRRKIRFRYFAGAGATWQWIRKPAHSLKLSLSTVYEQSQFRGSLYNDTRYNLKDEINVWRATLYLAGTHAVAQKRMRIFYDAYWQPVWGYAPNHRLQVDLGLEIPVWKKLSASLQYAYTREAVVLQGVKPVDRILTFGVTVKG